MTAIVLEMAVGIAGFFLGLAGCAALAVVEWAAWVIVLPSRRPGTLADQLEASPLEGTLGELIEAEASDGVMLAGIWHEADPSAPGHPALSNHTVLVIHGFAEDPSALREQMEVLNRHGWNVAAIDLRAHGRSEGDRSTFGSREGPDLHAWIASLAHLGKLGAKPVVAVWGRSMGAAIALRAALGEPTIAAIVLEAPYLDLEATLAQVLRRRRIPFAPPLARLILRRAETLAGTSLRHPRPFDLAPGIRVPVLVVHGAEDSLIPTADARKLARAFPRTALFVELPGAGHTNVVKTGGPALLEQVATFLDSSVAHR
jgi:alpha-beta hydrolase superfamily lysophospholipase